MLSGLIQSENAWEMHLLRPAANYHHGQLTDNLSSSKIFSSSKILTLAHPFISILPSLAKFSVQDTNIQNESSVYLPFYRFPGAHGTNTERCAVKRNSEFPGSASSSELI